MTEQHPITPPPELVQQWWEESNHRQYTGSEAEDYVVSMAAQWGADQELEACCEWFKTEGWNACHPKALVATRRPQPLSLKEQALNMLDKFSSGELVAADKMVDTIRRALEALPE
jgi:hypothetical protein